MNQITQLRQTLQPHLGWHGARITFLSLFLATLFRGKTVNLAEMATGFAGRLKVKRIHDRESRSVEVFFVASY